MNTNLSQYNDMTSSRLANVRHPLTVLHWSHTSQASFPSAAQDLRYLSSVAACRPSRVFCVVVTVSNSVSVYTTAACVRAFMEYYIHFIYTPAVYKRQNSSVI